MAILQTYVRNQGDAWQYTLENLSHFFESVLALPGSDVPEPPPADFLETADIELPVDTAGHLGFYLGAVQLLARRTAQMHLCLAGDTAEPAFAPERFSKLYQRSLYQSMLSAANRVLSQFEAALDHLPEPVRLAGERILSRRKPIQAVFQTLRDMPIAGSRIRCHGDYHLGQVLYTGKDFVIIDFEGEPARPVSERRIKRSALRDVAGMLRSFHYAAYSGLRNEKVRGLFHDQDELHMTAWADYWYRWVGATFLKHYLATAGKAGFLPETDEQIRALLNALLMEKAIYELGYELDNRPDWIHIPLEGIGGLLDIERRETL